MNCLNWKVIAGLAAIGIGLYFFAPKAAHTATLRGGVQEVDIEVKGATRLTS